MASPPLNVSLDKLEAALARIERGQADTPNLFAAENRADDEAQRSEALLADRDRTIAKLQADLADITRLKDQEIAALRAKLADRAAAPADTAPIEARYAQLRAAAEKTVSGIDRILAQAPEGGTHG
ncbi:MAG: hypothetical protein RLN87_07335 [Parasphingopyxis sp.]|uniref:hypothetical protein n=1 Tax=Parasphingopyxis sp. TaxID=1920299 RepID=UPI002608261B|nr:hypothetical protein [uncultured Parasphingopyxis sp.]